jgi:ribonucleoside-diphosphate reductase alpha chain
MEAHLNKKRFRTELAVNIFRQKYSQGTNDSWDNLVERMIDQICGAKYGFTHAILSTSEMEQLKEYIKEMKFIPGGRYLFYAGRENKFVNNCYLLKAEADTREEWANVVWRATSCLMTGGGIGVDYSVIRPSGRLLSKTGGISSGPLSLMQMVNEVGRGVMQGGSRRSAIYASLHHSHGDIDDFLTLKNWENIPVGDSNLALIKHDNFNFPAPLDMTNISVNYDDDLLVHRSGTGSILEFDHTNKIFLKNCEQAMRTGEPGFSFNFGAKRNETLRNACCEVTSEDDSDVCNLGSINIGAIESLDEFRSVVSLASKFLVCGTVRADLPYDKVRKVREKNRRLGLGLMGIHEWLLKRGSKYEVTPELHKWLEVYRDESEKAANEHCDRLYLSRPIAYRSVAPTGTIGILAGTTTGIEPLFAVAYKRRYLTEGTKWKYEYVIDHTADLLIKETGVKPEDIDTAYKMAGDYERRIKFQYDVQQYVDMNISSTLNLPPWGSKDNNEDTVERFATTLAKYAPGLRGMTCYPDGSRGGQPITEVEYDEALKHRSVVYEEHDPCLGGICSV